LKTTDIVVVDDRHDVWMLNDPQRSTPKWERLPRLPDLADMNEKSEQEAASAAVARMLDAER
jgi:hypothetical protein